MRKIALAVLVLGVVLAACGGGEKTAAPGPAETTAPPVTGGGDYCDLAKKYNDASAQILSSADFSKPEGLRKLFDEAKKAIETVRPVVPSEIKADFEVVVAGFLKYIAALEKANFDFAKIDPKDIESFSTPEFQAASQRLAAYGQRECGIAAPATAPS